MIRKRAISTACGCMLLAIGLLIPAAAHADVKIFSFKTATSSTRAGAHPDFSVSFELSSHDTELDPCDCKDAKDVIAHLPTGLFGNPHATPRCNIALFASDRCPTDAQVGIIVAELASGAGQEAGHVVWFWAPVFNLIPPPTQPGLLAFKSPLATPTFENVGARTDSDYGLDIEAASIEHFAPLVGFHQITWGVPAAPVHDYLRFSFGQAPPLDIAAVFGGGTENEPPFCDQNGEPSTEDPTTAYQMCPINELPARPISDIFGGSTGPIPSNSPETPFVQNPTTCGDASLVTSLDVLSYDGGRTHADSTWPATTDCAQLSFNPSQSIEPTTTAADSPSGAEVRLTVPQFESPDVPSPSELRAANVTLPAGFALAPNVMNGKVTCSDAEARFGTREEAHCPENAKIGTVSVETPVLPGPLDGSVYLGEAKPGHRYRLFLVFDGFGIHVKIAGSVTPDPQTGQIHIDFENLPQAPFETFRMHIFGSERGPLATPTRCGTYEVKSEWTPWDDALSEQTSRQFFTIDQGPNGGPCPSSHRPFGPGFQASSSASTGGAHTSFWLSLNRADGEQNLSLLSVTTPPGFSATLRGIPYCPETALARLSDFSYSGFSEQTSPLCPASQVGVATAAAGAGTHPLYLPGKVYLAGPYKGAPLSLEVVIPAIAGPYDLGNVAVRAAVNVDPLTGQVTTFSDPFPQIFGGIPIRTRQIFVNLDRPDFALNPTDCEPLSVTGRLTGDEGAQTAVSSHFQVSNCASLPFAPKLSLKLTGGVNRLGHPAIHALLTTTPGEANARSLAVTLPSNEFLDQAHIDTICTRVDFAAENCPAGSLLGHVEVTTPLLGQPLTGNAYLRSSAKKGLPDLALDLHGQLHLEAVARIDAVKGGLRTTFEAVPDVPLGAVKLDLLGGARGLIRNSESLCGAKKKATVAMVGQNGRAITRKIPLAAAACGRHGKHRRGGRR